MECALAIRSHAMLLALAVGLSGCSSFNGSLNSDNSAPSPNSSPAPQAKAAASPKPTAAHPPANPADTFNAANNAVSEGNYTQAEKLYLSVAAAPQQNSALRQHALISLTILYLKPDNPGFDMNAAIEMMDQLNATLSHNSAQRLQFNSLQQLLENTVLLTQLKQAGVKQQAEISALQNRVKGLETALERLRRITLQ